jgi:uncharacterized peroxidase-related enzyme
MRPDILNHYKPSLYNRARLWMINRILGPIGIDAARAAFYRPALFSTPYYKLQHHIMRGRSAWSVAQRERFAACVAAKINCAFCRTSHDAIAAVATRKSQQNSPSNTHLDNSKTSAMIQFLEKLTEQPWSMMADDLAVLRSHGISDQELHEAVSVCVIFCIGSRIAIALDFKTPTTQDLRRSAPLLLRMGYNLLA